MIPTQRQVRRGDAKMDVQELAFTAGRSLVIYAFLLVVVRLLGKRAVGNFSAFDLIVALILGEVVDEPIYGDVPVIQALLAIAVVAFLHYVNSLLSFRSVTFDRLTGGVARVLVRNGEIDRDGLAMERVNEEELKALLRMQEVDELGEIKEARLEASGHLSVIKTEQAKELQKGDLKRAFKEGA